MIQELTLPQVVNRLQILEERIQVMSAKLDIQEPDPVRFEFVIQVNGQEVWSGIHVEEQYPDILREYPNAEIAIGGRSSPVVLI